MKRIVMTGLVLALSSGCVAHLTKTEPEDPDTKTIGFFTGTGLNDAEYDRQFRGGAEKACGGRPYKVLQTGRHPSTLKGVEKPSSEFFWVIRCY